MLLVTEEVLAIAAGCIILIVLIMVIYIWIFKKSKGSNETSHNIDGSKGSSHNIDGSKEKPKGFIKNLSRWFKKGSTTVQFDYHSICNSDVQYIYLYVYGDNKVYLLTF